ncbi:MAG TPA: hypothetical protein VII25_04950 [Candidatus Acidoferrum sp.]|jgi:hypothetical protein
MADESAVSSAGRGMWNLRELVERYIALADGFGHPLPLSQFPLNEVEIVRLFGSFDEDYHISRFLHFSKLTGKTYAIGGEEVTHVSIAEAIKEIL